MPEVYAGIKPGRRPALLVSIALVLVIAVGLAWWQTHEARALAAPVVIPGTPLRVQVPVRWKPDPHKPAAFILPTRGASGQQAADFERRISFQYEHTAGFVPPQSVLSSLRGISEMEPARIGPFDAVQVRRQEQRRWGIGQSILRVAVLPNGDRVSVLYLPMSALTAADLELLDKICEAVRFDAQGPAIGWAEACAKAGLELPESDGWRVAEPQLGEAPGFFIGGQQRASPAWSLGVFRTWLAGGRQASDLLKDFAAEYWLLDDVSVTRPEWARADGASLALMRHPNAARNRTPICEALVVAESPEKVLLVFVYTDEHYIKSAEEAAERVAREARLRPLASIPDIDAAEQAGREFAAKLAASGAVPWWGELPAKLNYTGSTLAGEVTVSVAREAVGRKPVRGYRGSSIAAVSNHYEEVTRWEAARSGKYDFQTQRYIAEGQVLEMHETRGGRDEPVKRTSRLNEAERAQVSFMPGPGFISPPLEELAVSWVARESQAALLNECSGMMGRQTYMRLQRPLAAEGRYARAFVQEDFWPFGEILGFDESGELQFHRSATVEYQRAPEARF